MKTTVRATSMATIAGLAVATAATLATPASASTETARRAEHPVFVQTDNPGGNTVVAYDRGPGGALTQAGTHSTGGRGGILDGSVVDHLASEGSLTYDQRHGLLYAVNAGSDTGTVFAVQGDRLSRKQVITSGGRFPVSVAVHGDLVYVLNALDGGSIQGYRRVGDNILRIPAWNRKLGLDAALPMAGITALRTLRSRSILGRRVLITGAAGGVGRYAVQWRPSAAPMSSPRWGPRAAPTA